MKLVVVGRAAGFATSLNVAPRNMILWIAVRLGADVRCGLGTERRRSDYTMSTSLTREDPYVRSYYVIQSYTYQISTAGCEAFYRGGGWSTASSAFLRSPIACLGCLTVVEDLRSSECHSTLCPGKK